jgi:osmotically-inducible protein OsmY
MLAIKINKDCRFKALWTRPNNYFVYFILLSVSIFLVPATYAEDLSEKVSERLADLQLGPHELDISNWRGEVKLSGYVSSKEDKEAILDAVKSLDGVEEISETLSIQAGSAKPVSLDDKKVGEARLAEVSAAAESYLNGIKVKGSHSLKYEINDQGILIKGELPAGVEKQALVYHIKRQVSTPIQESIVVRPWPSDKELEARVRTALGDRQGLDLKGISITAQEGVVTIAGKKANHHEADQLATAVLMVEGVRDVKSVVTFAGSRDDP